ncbi:MAG: class I SAM-dependent methyltransferase [Planctomycetes bacterium]|nr:class I SAM-dependent methyltransferase [Planctomycetota bacterium]
MSTADSFDDRPAYDHGQRQMLTSRGPRARDFATQLLDTTAPFLRRPASELRVLDVGCGYGHTCVELARRCARVVGIEPSTTLHCCACQLREESGLENLQFLQQSIYEFSQREAYDLVVLDNVLEHLPDQPRALEILSAALRRGGVLYLLVPNKLWPIEVHYGLPFLGYLPLRLANRYLRLTRRGVDYTDASYAPTYFSLNRMLRARGELSFQYVLPAHLELATFGNSLHYRVGAALIGRCRWLWIVSKVLLVVAKKHGTEGI